MVCWLSFRVSWICLFLFSSATCLPVAKEDETEDPYTDTGGSGVGSAPGSNSQSGGSPVALINLQPAFNHQQAGAASQHTSSSSSEAAGLSPSDQPNSFIVSHGSSSNTPASAPSQGVGYVSQPVFPPPSPGTGKPSFSVQPQSVSGTSGISSTGSGAVSSVHGASTHSTAGNVFPALDFGYGPVPYIGAPAVSDVAGFYSNSLSAGTAGQTSRTTGDLGDGPVPYHGAPAVSSSGAASHSVGYVSQPVFPPPSPGTGKPSFSVQPQSVSGSSGISTLGSGVTSGSGANTYYAREGGAPGGLGGSVSDSGAPTRYYNAAGASSSGVADFTPGLTWVNQAAGGADGSSYDTSNWMPSRDFPDFNVWNSNAGMANSDAGMTRSMSETSPQLPSSYIIQSRNGYQRALEVLSHTKYSPEYPEPPVSAEPPVSPSMTPDVAVTGTKGGIKYYRG